MKTFRTYEEYILATKTTEDVIVMDDGNHADAEKVIDNLYYYSNLDSCAYSREDVAVYFTDVINPVEAICYLVREGYGVDTDDAFDCILEDALTTICTWASDSRKNKWKIDGFISDVYNLPCDIHKEIVEQIMEDQEENETTRKTWYIFDSESAIINEDEGIEDRYDAIDDFKNRFSEEKAREYGFTLCLVEEDDKCWYECLEELTADDIY